ncbi:hypothetical protein DICPUDRAFT_158049 [Dictyostelium purpureum]|uniref:Dehydrogenase/reductase SDR family member 12 n=1 Tax=Dictyostelium purpureum TaxID=5786 RepID=F1A0P6_DICPU|nr:uncharacterized protein DICPUDRAFT_158049 [Dictyostelium purpureum]EGC30235.1 hypothetical protein DICPUDRAFT_158049 [Dictyostelium purpureum]|eukprot:XP_003293249.1 hypothetical protein DICPUDRAFT_158049 [Dictyostelium purpureum]
MITGAKWFWNGLMNYTSRAYNKKKEHFNENDLVQDISNKHFIVTGANSGIGYETSVQLSKRGGNVHLVCRSKEKGEKALMEIKEKTNSDKVHLHVCDISLINDIKSFVQQWKDNGNQRVDVLIHNAGVMNKEREETSEGIEKTFATNILAPFLLTELLVIRNDMANNGTSNEKKRVIFVTSAGMLTQKMNCDFQFNNVKEGKQKWDGMLAYAQTKREMVYLTELFAEKNKDINFYTMHPCWTNTEGLTKSMPMFNKLVGSQLRTPEEGADTIVWLSMSPTVENNSSGLFFEDRHSVDKYIHNSHTESPKEDVDKLWNYLNDFLNK